MSLLKRTSAVGARPPLLVINAGLGLTVWITWSLVFADSYFGYLRDHWEVALTMIPGSLVGGGTSEGGGAVAFPVLTKLLAVPADQARVFTFAIQSVGMGCAALALLVARVPVEMRAIVWGTPPAIIGVVVSILVLGPTVPLPIVRVVFTMIAASLGIALVAQLCQKGYLRNQMIPTWCRREKIIVACAGFLGGMFSGVAGIGVDFVFFILLVLLFRVCEKITTPTTVVLMAIISVVGFACHVLVTGQFSGQIVGFWIAAAPVVAVGAPLGAWICTKMSPLMVRSVLLGLLALELVSTVLLVPMTTTTVLAALLSLMLMMIVSVAMIRYQGYSSLSN